MEAKEIKALHKNSGLSNKEFAKAIGVSDNAIWNWEAGKTSPTEKSVQKLEAFQAKLNGGTFMATPAATGKAKKLKSKKVVAAVPKPEINTQERTYTVSITDDITGNKLITMSTKERQMIMDIIDRLI